MDLTGDEATVGKAVGKDVTQGTISFPVALALDSAPLHRRALAKAFAQRTAEARLGRLVRHALVRSNAVPRALEVVEHELAPVTHLVAGLPPSVARDTLASVCAAMGLRGS